MTTTDNKDGVKMCTDYLNEIGSITGIRPRVIMVSAPSHENDTIITYAMAENRQDLAQKVMDAFGERIETTRLLKQKIRRPEPWRSLQDYFTEERLINNPLVSAEKEVLEANNYVISTDFYLALDVPPGNGPLEMVVFLFAASSERNKLDQHLPEIRKKIS